MSQLKKKNQVVTLVKKSNRLVEGRYNFDIWETRVFSTMVSRIKISDNDFQNYRIYVADLVNEYGLENSKSPYDRVKAAARSLVRKIIRIEVLEEGEVMELDTPIVAGVKSPKKEQKGKGFVDLSFHPDMKPLLLQLKKEFTTYDVRNILRLPSTYSIRIYELLKQYERIGKRTFILTELKEMVGVLERLEDSNGEVTFIDRYPLYGNFKQRVILQAQKDLKAHTDIVFDFDPIKKGRKFHEIIFYISKNKPKRNQTSKQIAKEVKEEKQIHVLFDKIKDWKDITEASVRSLYKKYGIERLYGAYSQTTEAMQSKTIESPGKYFYNLAHNAPSLFEEIKEKEQNPQLKIEEQKQREKEREKLKLKKASLSERIVKMKGEKLKYIEKNMTAEYKIFLEEMKKNRYYKSDMSFAENQERKGFSSFLHLELKKVFPEEYTEVNKIEAEAREIEKQINSL